MGVNILSKLKHDISSSDNLNINEIQLLRIQYLKKSGKLKVIIKSSNDFNKDHENELKNLISKRLGYFEDIELICYKDISNASMDIVSKNYWLEIVNTLSSIMPISRDFLLKSKREVENNKLTIHSGNSFIFKILKNKGIENHIKNCISDIFGIKCEVNVVHDSNLESCNSFDSLDKENENMLKEILNDIKNSQQSEAKKGSKPIPEDDTSLSDNIIMGKIINEDSIEIKSIDETSGYVTICGDIFKKEIIETKTGRKIITFYITDYSSSITVKCFPKPKDIEKAVEEIKEGLHCKVRGEAVNDSYAKEVVVMARDIVKLAAIEKSDTAEEKRVELHVHTTMSSMDAVTSASKLISQAAKWGHKAIAITDHGVVQAYPEAMESGKKNNIKVIYGVEAYFVDDGIPIVVNSDSRSLNEEFVVFDIETTGLSCRDDKIIEIGAVKIKNGNIIDTFSEFVNPKINIPSHIKELTGIDDEMVRDAKGIEEVLPMFIEFVGNSAVAAHNAGFDVSFIKKNCNDYKFDFTNSVLDTIPLCKFLFPDLKKYKLDIVAKHLNISLDNHHRAIDDAKATAEILMKCFKLLKEKNIHDINELNKQALSNQDIKKLQTYHMIILVKNQTGLKNLYKLISFSHLDFYYRRPRIPKSLLEQYREGLIIGSACEAGQIYREILHGKSDEELNKLISFYDYLEIQPLGNNNFLVKNGTVKSIEQLIDINRKICALGESNNIPVVATCDVHFIDPKDEVFRRILMHGQGFTDADEQAPLYLRTTNEMLREFAYLGEETCKEVVITNTIKIADMIEDVKPIPDETFPPKIDGAEEEIKKMTLDKVHLIYGDNLPEVVQKRLDKELNSIINNGYAVLYLIAQKLVAKSLEDGYLVGSRGSVGSSFVATMSNITEVNGLPPHYICHKCKYSEFIMDGSISSGADLPDKSCPMCGSLLKKDGHDIPFETFLGFEGDKEPDIDLNFSGEYQAVVHRYTETLFGKGYTFKAGTIGTIAEKTAYGFVKKYLSEKDLVVSQAEVERLTIGCTGIKRTTGQHPGGIMVVPNDNEIYNFTPVQHPADDSNSEIITTHFDYHSISGRLLKLDILGHDDPTVLRMLQDLTCIDPKTIPLADAKVLSLFTSPDALGISAEELGCEVGTYGLPEFGTKFVRQMLLDTKPQTFSDLVRISGLSHGTDVWLNNAQYYIKEGYTTLKDCISTRDDIMVYLIYKGLPPKTAFNIMEKVRKGKGLTEEHEQVMREYKVPDWYIESCKKIKYMFPKGHAVAYVMMAVRIAYFKVYYPKAYYATYFTVRADDFDADLIVKGEDAISAKMAEINALGNNTTQKDKGLLTVLEISYEMYKRKIKFLKVDLYKSDAIKFVIEDEGIRPPIKALQGVGESAAKGICEARKDGEFISMEDLRLRSKVSKTVIETLAAHGCLNGLPESNQLSLFSSIG